MTIFTWGQSLRASRLDVSGRPLSWKWCENVKSLKDLLDQIGWDQKILHLSLETWKELCIPQVDICGKIGSFIGYMVEKQTESLPPIIAYQCFLPFAPEEEQENAEGV